MYLFVGIFAGNGVKTNYFYLNRFHLNKLASLYKMRFEVQILVYVSIWRNYSDIHKFSHAMFFLQKLSQNETDNHRIDFYEALSM